jgi:hypothetical protein
MRTLAAAVVAIFFGALLIAALAAMRAVDARHIERMRPATAAALVLESRRTPPVEAGGNGSALVGVGAIVVVGGAIGATILLAQRGGELLRQYRLTFKRRPQRTGATMAAVPRIQEVPRVMLPPGAQEGQYDEVSP